MRPTGCGRSPSSSTARPTPFPGCRPRRRPATPARSCAASRPPSRISTRPRARCRPTGRNPVTVRSSPGKTRNSDLPDLPLRRRLLSVLARWRADPHLGRAVSDKATIYVDVPDERGRRMIESGGGFNPDCVAMWRQLLARDRWTHIVDVGANYGEMLVNVDLPSTARVIAVEPNPRVLPYLERTLRKAGVRVELVRKAVADRIGTAPLRLDLVWSGTSGLAEAGEVAPDARYELTSVPTTTLAALIADGGQTSRIRALVKIDVEGHEPQVLQGVMDIIGALARFEALA